MANTGKAAAPFTGLPLTWTFRRAPHAP